MYRRRGRKQPGIKVLEGQEAGEIDGNYATMHDILQSKKCLRQEAKKKGGENPRCMVCKVTGPGVPAPHSVLFCFISHFKRRPATASL